MKTFYLAHNFELRKLTRKWQLKLERKYWLKLDNPFYDNTARMRDMAMLDSLKEGSAEQRKYFATRDSAPIVEDDLEKIRKSDGLVALANQTRIGTPMEIFFAARILRIPVYVITKKYLYHPWIQTHATRIFRNKKEFEEFVDKTFGHRNDSTGYYNME